MSPHDWQKVRETDFLVTRLLSNIKEIFPITFKLALIVRHDLTPSAQALTDYMSELSEAAFCAGWHSGLEFDLWRAVIDGPRRYASLDITAEHIAKLRRLSEACGGWVYFDDETEETFVSLEDWRRRYAEYSE